MWQSKQTIIKYLFFYPTLKQILSLTFNGNNYASTCRLESSPFTVYIISKPGTRLLCIMLIGLCILLLEPGLCAKSFSKLWTQIVKDWNLYWSEKSVCSLIIQNLKNLTQTDSFFSLTSQGLRTSLLGFCLCFLKCDRKKVKT